MRPENHTLLAMAQAAVQLAAPRKSGLVKQDLAGACDLVNIPNEAWKMAMRIHSDPAEFGP